MSVRIITGDCREIMPALEAVDAVVTDPPYELGFMGMDWDRSGVAFDPATWCAALAVMKPGAHLVAFGGTRTFHRLWCAIEDAGFEMRETLMWVYGSGFPKSLDVSKAIDKSAGITGSFGAGKPNFRSRGDHAFNDGWRRPWMDDPEAIDKSGREYIPATVEAKEWRGWGTALKPAWEPICLARKPLAGTVAANVLAHGTGALNIDGCRVPVDAEADASQLRTMNRSEREDDGWGMNTTGGDTPQVVRPDGRWPANLCHDGSDEVLALFPDSKSTGGAGLASSNFTSKIGVYGTFRPKQRAHAGGLGDNGSAARFFYCAKASSAERAGSKHPTVKPLALMRWLVRLVTPPGGLVLDPFAGSGSTLLAAETEGFRAIGIEISPEYATDAERRIRGDAPLLATVSA